MIIDFCVQNEKIITSVSAIITSICAIITAGYIIKNSSKHDENIEQAFNKFAEYCSLLYEQHQTSTTLSRELFHQNIKPRFEVERYNLVGILSNGNIKYEITFKNKGQGSACDAYIKYAGITSVNIYDKTVFKLTEHTEKNVINFDETISFEFTNNDVNCPDCIHILVPLFFNDMAERKYKQEFELIIHYDGHTDLMNCPEVTEVQ